MGGGRSREAAGALAPGSQMVSALSIPRCVSALDIPGGSQPGTVDGAAGPREEGWLELEDPQAGWQTPRLAGRSQGKSWHLMCVTGVAGAAGPHGGHRGHCQLAHL